MQQIPLARYRLFHSQDLDEAREQVARVFCPHRLDTIGRGRFAACQHHLAGERLSLNYIEYGAKTLIAPGELRNFYLLQIPLEGGAAIVNGTERYYSHPGAAAMLNPHLPTTMIWEEGCRQLLLRIDRKSMQDHLSAQLGATADKPLTFFGAMDVTQGGGAQLRELLLHLVAQADAGHPTIGCVGLLARQMESTLLSAVLEAQHHNYSARVLGAGAGQGPRVPRHVARAEAHMEAHLDQPLTIEDVAQAVGVTPRSLQIGFRRFRNKSPMQFLRERRLGQAHQDLAAGRPGTTVTDVAMRWGFSHFGRFSESYRARFGCKPVETLRAARSETFID